MTDKRDSPLSSTFQVSLSISLSLSGSYEKMETCKAPQKMNDCKICVSINFLHRLFSLRLCAQRSNNFPSTTTIDTTTLTYIFLYGCVTTQLHTCKVIIKRQRRYLVTPYHERARKNELFSSWRRHRWNKDCVHSRYKGNSRSEWLQLCWGLHGDDVRIDLLWLNWYTR